ncbi:hypothetical protein QZH41_016303, partial [Actinostola sp. cb2023]
MSMTSDEVNFLVYRYLQESGFQHSAFTFGIESHIDQSNINGSVVPPGALVSVLQKGVQYVESEATLTELAIPVFTKGKKQLDPVSIEKTRGIANVRIHVERVIGLLRQKYSILQSTLPIDYLLCTGKDAQNCPMVDRMEGGVLDDSELDQLSLIDAVLPDIISLRHSLAGGKIIKTDLPFKNEHIHASEEVYHVNSLHSMEYIDGSKALVLRGHESEVFVCSWHPIQDILATGGEDGTARLWFINDNGSPIILDHKPKDQQDNNNLDISSLEWNNDGMYLASGCCNGCARIWTPQDPTLDVDWQNSNCFASCSTDKDIHICKIGQDKPFKSFRGHTGEVNTIRWDPSGTYLASCSVDMSVKIWSLKQDLCIQDLLGHKKEIYIITWSPGSISCPLLLASTGKTGNLVHTFQGNGAVYEVQWNSKGDKLAACFSTSL